MKISIVQADIAWENKELNYSRFSEMLDGVKQKTDLVVLPEMFNTGFSMNSGNLAEGMTGRTMEWMQKTAYEGDFGLMGSFIAKTDDKYYNRLVFMKPDGTFSGYDKGHLFRMEKENMFFTKGNKRVVDRFREFNFSLQICYDLRFPVWSRNMNNTVDIIVYVANWPESRRKVWNTLLKARAIENQCFVVGVNRIGSDGNNIDYCGDSVIINARGETVCEAEINKEEVVSAEISLDELNEFRRKFPVWLDADNFTLLSD